MHAKKRKSVYFLYADKWWISARWSGAAVNVINEMFVLSERYEVFYNDIFVNDLFDERGVLDEEAFVRRYNAYCENGAPEFSRNLKKILKPSRLYYASFYRPGRDEAQVRFFLEELMEPKIYGHSFHPHVWRCHLVGFQNQTSKSYAESGRLRSLGDDGTLSYSEIDCVPPKSFIRLQACIRMPISFDEQVQIRKQSRFRRALNSEFVIAIGGTITEHTSPISHISVIEKLRARYPKLNITLVIYSLNVLVDLPKKDWIVIQQYSKAEQDDALCAADVLLNTWRQESQHYSASNKILEAMSYGIPIITPNTMARVEQLGSTYPLYHTFECKRGRLSVEVEEEIYNLLEKCLDEKFRREVSKYLSVRARYFSREAVAAFYSAQLKKLHRKKVLIVNHSLNVGGVEQYTIDVIKALSDTELSVYSALEVSKQRLDQIRALCPSIRFVSDCAESYDFVFLNSFPTQLSDLSCTINRLRQANRDVKIVPITHTDIHEFTKNISKLFELTYKHVTVADIITKKIGSALGKDISTKSVLVTPALSYAAREAGNARLIGRFRRRLAYFGRVVPIKGVLHLIRYFVRYVRESPQSELALDICGPFANESFYRACLDAIPEDCGGRVTIHNRVFNATERAALFEKVDYLVYTTAMEGLPYTYLEAMREGVPVISTAVGGVEHLIKDGVNGFLMRFPGLYLPDLDVESPYNELVERLNSNEEANYLIFKSVVERAYLSYEVYKNISSAAQRIVSAEFQLMNFAKKIRDIVYGV